MTIRTAAALLLSTLTATAQTPAAVNTVPPDPGTAARGVALFSTTYNCAACHGANGRGGPGGIPDLTQSPIAMSADANQLLGYLRVGRPDRGMPAFPAISENEAASLSARLRMFAAPAVATPSPGPGGRGRGGPGGGAGAGGADANAVLVGDIATGKAFFNGPVGKCSSCHAVEAGQASSAGNLSAIASKYPNPRTLQNNMLLNRGLAWSPQNGKDVTATITYRDGRIVTGYLSSISDFKVIIRNDEGVETTIPRSQGEPRVVLKDRLQHHLDLLDLYNDDDIHNLTSYLATLK